MRDKAMYHIGTAIMVAAAAGVGGSLAALVYNARHHGPTLAIAAIAVNCLSMALCFVSVAVSRERVR
jgi:hypothetical protein